jgi:hypothetical protein
VNCPYEETGESVLIDLFSQVNMISFSQVNTLVWKCLGYRFNVENEEWTPDEVFPKWREKYPTPPDLIGMRRIYSKEIDQPSLKSNQSIVRSVPAEFKQSLKKHLKPLGFRGYKVRFLDRMGYSPSRKCLFPMASEFWVYKSPPFAHHSYFC